MAGFFNHPFKVLDRILNLNSSQAAPTDFDVGASIQPVYDLSRQGERAGTGPNQGYFIVTASQTHAGVGELSDAVNLYTPASASSTYPNVDPQREWLWFIDSWGVTNDRTDLKSLLIYLNGGYGSSGFSLLGPHDGGTIVQARKVLAHYDDSHDFAVDTGLFPLFNLLGVPHPVPLPCPIPFAQGVLRFGSESDSLGTVTITGAALIWRGPLGTTPPGMS